MRLQDGALQRGRPQRSANYEMTATITPSPFMPNRDTRNFQGALFISAVGIEMQRIWQGWEGARIGIAEP